MQLREHRLKLLRSEILRAELAVNRQWRKQFFRIKSRLSKRASQRLSSRRKELMHKTAEIARRCTQPIIAAHPHQRRFDFRGGPERLGWKSSQKLDARKHLRHHRQWSVCF